MGTNQSGGGRGGVDPAGLGRIVDDASARQQAADWAFAEVAGGRTPEEVEADLLAAGWSADDAAEMAERARKQSRFYRGKEGGRIPSRVVGQYHPADPHHDR